MSRRNLRTVNYRERRYEDSESGFGSLSSSSSDSCDGFVADSSDIEMDDESQLMPTQSCIQGLRDYLTSPDRDDEQSSESDGEASYVPNHKRRRVESSDNESGSERGSRRSAVRRRREDNADDEEAMFENVGGPGNEAAIETLYMPMHQQEGHLSEDDWETVASDEDDWETVRSDEDEDEDDWETVPSDEDDWETVISEAGDSDTEHPGSGENMDAKDVDDDEGDQGGYGDEGGHGDEEEDDGEASGDDDEHGQGGYGDDNEHGQGEYGDDNEDNEGRYAEDDGPRTFLRAKYRIQPIFEPSSKEAPIRYSETLDLFAADKAVHLIPNRLHVRYKAACLCLMSSLEPHHTSPYSYRPLSHSENKRPVKRDI